MSGVATEAGRLAGRLAGELPRPVVILGVGNPLRSDDGAGPAFVGLLPELPGLSALDCGATPENMTRPALSGAPASALIVDCGALGAEPGAAAIVAPESLANEVLYTDGAAMPLLIERLREGGISRISALVFQPRTVAVGEGLSEIVQLSVGSAAAAFAASFRQRS